jgi:aryl-alcohol dehydrogenase-like predicted oxidoreductase
MNKIVIGTANFDKIYGIQKRKLPKKIINSKILKILLKSKIKFLDTAFDYDNKLFKGSNLKRFKIINKVKLPKKNIDFYIKNFENIFISKLKALGIDHFDYLLIHKSNDLKGKNGQIFLNKILNLKRNKYIKKVGVSIYEPKELLMIYKNFIPDLIQAPLNIFDQRIINSNFYDLIKKNDTKLQIRSIFLQGILLKNINELKKMKVNKKLITKISTFEQLCKKNNISRLEACVSFVKNIKDIKFITIGFNSDIELKQILKSFKSKKKVYLKKSSIVEKKLIDPRKW